RAHPAVASQTAAKRLLASAEAWAELYRNGEALAPEVLVARQNDMSALVTPLEAFALARTEALRRLDATGAATFEGGLVITAQHRALGLDLLPYSGFDLVYSATGSLGGSA